MKTATIRVLPIFGTRNGWVADIFYRGKRLYSFDGTVPNALLEKARVWSFNQGFTHIKASLG